MVNDASMSIDFFVKRHPHYFITDGEAKKQVLQSLERSFNTSTLNIMHQIETKNNTVIYPDSK